MTATLNTLLVGEHAADLRRAAKRYNSAQSGSASSPKVVTLRRAQASDARALRILAELDEQPELSGEALLALDAGEAVAAISLEDGRVVSDPFVATSDAVSLLKIRARQLLGRRPRKPRPRWRPRFA